MPGPAAMPSSNLQVIRLGMEIFRFNDESSETQIWTISMLYLSASLAVVGICQGLLFSIRTLLSTLVLCALLSAVLAFFCSLQEVVTAAVSAVALQIGYFLGMLIRAMMEVIARKGRNDRSRERSPTPFVRNRTHDLNSTSE
jgi:hypothetical protein